MCSTAVCPGMSDPPPRTLPPLSSLTAFWGRKVLGARPAVPSWTHFVSSGLLCLVKRVGGVYLRTFLSLGGLDGDQSPSSGPGLPVGGDAQGRAVSPFRWAGGGQGCFSSVTRVSKEGPGLQTLLELLRTECCLFLTLRACRAEAVPVGWLPCVSHLSLPLS